MPRPPRPVTLPRLHAVPLAEPPYDRAVPQAEPAHDDRGSRHAFATPPPVQGTLALALDRSREPAVGRSAPDARRLRGLGQALAEILAGRRPAGTVADRLTERAYAELLRAGKMIHSSRPPVAGLPHVNQPHDGAVEACVLVHCGERSHVLALRLERRGAQWLCTDFETA